MPCLACAKLQTLPISARYGKRPRGRLLLAGSSGSITLACCMILSLAFQPGAIAQTVDANGVSGTVLVNVTLNAPAGSTAVLARNPGGGIILRGGDVHSFSSSGMPTTGLLAHTMAEITSSANITSTGDHGHAVQAGQTSASASIYDGSSAGTVYLTGGAVRTDGAFSVGLHALDSGVINASDVVVSAAGNGAIGAHGQSASTITLNHATIGATGAGGSGILASNERLGTDALAQGGAVSASNTAITASGYETHAAVARDGGKIILSGGSVTASGNAGAGLVASGRSQIESNTVVATQGAGGLGVLASHNGAITLTGGTVTTSGVDSCGIMARNGGHIDSAADITTTGDRATGVQTGAASPGASIYDGSTAGTASLTHGVISTTGMDAPGLRAFDAGRINAGPAQVRTSGAASFGAEAESNSYIALDQTQVKTSGASAHGLVATNSRRRDNFDLTAAGGVIQGRATVDTTGVGAHGAIAAYGGRLALSGGALSASGAGSTGLLVQDHGVALIDNTAITSVQDMAIRSHNSAVIALTGAGTIVRGNNAAMGASFSLPDQHAAFAVGPGVQLSSASDVLLAVDRGGSGGGGSGVVSLAFGDDSQAAGDLVDSDAKTTGFSDVTFGARAAWAGMAKGVRHVFALNGGADLHFRSGSALEGDITASNAILRFGDDGVSIAGHVVLGDRSLAHGGSLATPIYVHGSMSVDASSHQAGNWRIHGDLTNHGVIAPGSSPGVIRTDGDLHLAASTIYRTDITANGRSDLISVGGRANLAGRVSVYPEQPGVGYLIDHRYTIVTASGGLGGTVFGGGAAWADGSTYVFLTPTLAYDATNAYLVIARNRVPMEEVAGTPNQAGVGQAVDQLPTNDSLFTPVANLPTASAASAAFQLIAGDVYTSLASALVEDGRNVRDALNARLIQASGSRIAGKSASMTETYGLGASFWGQVIGAWGRSSAAHGASASVNRSSGGFLVGGDAPVNDIWRVGLAGGYARSSVSTQNRLSSGIADSYHLAAYGSGAFGKVNLRSGVAYTWNDTEVRRVVTFPGFADRVAGSQTTGMAQMFGEIGYLSGTDTRAVEPFVNLAWLRLSSARFREAGGPAALAGLTPEISTTFTTLGVRMAQSFVLTNGNVLTARGLLGWRRAFGDTDPHSVMMIAGRGMPSVGIAFGITGAPIASNAIVLETGLDMAVAPNLSLGATWGGQFGGRARDQSLKGDITLRF